MRGLSFLLFCISYGFAYGFSLFSLVDVPNQIEVRNEKATLIIEKDPWKVSMKHVNGQVQFEEYESLQFLIEDEWIAIRSFESIEFKKENEVAINAVLSNARKIRVNVSKVQDFGFSIEVDVSDATKVRGTNRLVPVEEVYGFGETWNGELGQRGENIEIWNHVGTPDECSYMPYYVSTNNYAFFLNYGGRVSFDVGQKHSGKLVYEATTGSYEAFLFAGESVADAIANYLKETGMPAKPPRWAFKPWFWLMGDPAYPGAGIESLRDYHFMEMINKLDSMNYPVGVTWFEPPWQTARTTFIANPDFTENIVKTIDEIEDAGVKVLGWTVPYTTVGAANFDEAVKNNYLVRNPDLSVDTSQARVSSSGEIMGNYYNYIDFYHPGASAWWKDQISASLRYGLRGFKLDAGQNLQEDALISGDRLGKDYHNSYALEYNRVFFEALTEIYEDDFLMIPRATWVGSTSYTNFKWPGDLSGTFGNNGLPSSLYSSLSLAMSGFPFVSSDIGGFEKDKRTPEDVWIRWAQFGTFLPGMQTLQMPWWFSKEAQDHFRFLTHLHTDLIPYWQSLAYQASEGGDPILRPLVLDYQNDLNTWPIDDQFMVGPYILVAPIINPEPERDVYLPEGQWIDFWDPQNLISGKQKIRWLKEKGREGLWKFPLYIKEGAILPMEVSDVISGFGSPEHKDHITIAVWPKEKGSSQFILKDREGPVKINVGKVTGDDLRIDWTPSRMDYIFRIQYNNKPSSVTVISSGRSALLNELENLESGKVDGWVFDKSRSLLFIRTQSYDTLQSLLITKK